MTTVGRHIPLYDAWSNEGGGRAIEEGIRYSERKAIERMEADVARWSSANRERAWAAFETRQAAARAAFVEKYGAEALTDKDAFLKANSAGDGVELSPFAKAMLADLDNLESSRFLFESGRKAGDEIKRVLENSLAGAKALYESRQHSYDARFLRDDNARADAYERAQAAGQRLEELAARSQARHAEAARRAGEVAAATPSPESLFVTTKLFEFPRDGTLRIDASALSNMGPAAAATSELARLIGALTERNGLGQLRDALIGALNGQNRRIAESIGAA